MKYGVIGQAPRLQQGCTTFEFFYAMDSGNKGSRSWLIAPLLLDSPWNGVLLKCVVRDMACVWVAAVAVRPPSSSCLVVNSNQPGARIVPIAMASSACTDTPCSNRIENPASNYSVQWQLRLFASARRFSPTKAACIWASHGPPFFVLPLFSPSPRERRFPAACALGSRRPPKSAAINRHFAPPP